MSSITNVSNDTKAMQDLFAQRANLYQKPELLTPKPSIQELESEHQHYGQRSYARLA